MACLNRRQPIFLAILRKTDPYRECKFLRFKRWTISFFFFLFTPTASVCTTPSAHRATVLKGFSNVPRLIHCHLITKH
jgi:hypothetical protein